ncbi:hypothetical protein AGMMS49959_01570 [Planctomycetales bacterium]|nr:hypothetical protein AGMMS49959_01570 [Planctomycetales bacterium]
MSLPAKSYFGDEMMMFIAPPLFENEKGKLRMYGERVGSRYFLVGSGGVFMGKSASAREANL